MRRTGATLLVSFMPETAEKILKQINAPQIDYDELGHAGNYPAENQVTDKPEILFQRLKLDEVMEKVDAQRKAQGLKSLKELEEEAEAEKKAAEKAKQEKASEKEDSAYVHKPACTIVKCEEVKKSRKLLCSQVDLGDKTVQILSGLRPQYTPEMMTGKKVMVIANLAPRKMAGLESQGMILCAEMPDGTLSIMTPDKAETPGGSEIG